MKTDKIEKLIINIRGVKVIIDSEIAKLYGVETRDINKAVKNNPAKFPNGYIFKLTKEELDDLRWNFSTAKLTKTRTLPKVFTEKGLYMLATILKSNRAIQTTIAIIETFAKLRIMSAAMKRISIIQDKEEQKLLMNKTSELMGDLIYDDLEISESETSIELNFAVLKMTVS